MNPDIKRYITAVVNYCCLGGATGLSDEALCDVFLLCTPPKTFEEFSRALTGDNVEEEPEQQRKFSDLTIEEQAMINGYALQAEQLDKFNKGKAE